MDERYVIECPEQQFQRRQSFVKKNKSEIKQEKKMSKTESRFKSKLGKRIQRAKQNESLFFFSLEFQNLFENFSIQHRLVMLLKKHEHFFAR